MVTAALAALGIVAGVPIPAGGSRVGGGGASDDGARRDRGVPRLAGGRKRRSRSGPDDEAGFLQSLSAELTGGASLGRRSSQLPIVLTASPLHDAASRRSGNAHSRVAVLLGSALPVNGRMTAAACGCSPQRAEGPPRQSSSHLRCERRARGVDSGATIPHRPGSGIGVGWWPDFPRSFCWARWCQADSTPTAIPHSVSSSSSESRCRRWESPSWLRWCGGRIDDCVVDGDGCRVGGDAARNPSTRDRRCGRVGTLVHPLPTAAVVISIASLAGGVVRGDESAFSRRRRDIVPLADLVALGVASGKTVRCAREAARPPHPDLGSRSTLSWRRWIVLVRHPRW